MSVLGRPYRIMYLSKGISGLTNIYAYVLKPDESIAGYFPLHEVGGPFVGCYVYDFLTTVDDNEGEYFSRVVSPTEGRVDIVRFSLYRDGGGASVAPITPNQLTGYLERAQLVGRVPANDTVRGFILNDDLEGKVNNDESLDGSIDAQNEVEGQLENQILKGEIYEQFNLP